MLAPAGRFASLTAGALLTRHDLLAALVCGAIALFLLVLQLKFTPFLEVPTDVGTWRSLNYLAVIGHVCQIIVVGGGAYMILETDR